MGGPQKNRIFIKKITFYPNQKIFLQNFIAWMIGSDGKIKMLMIWALKESHWDVENSLRCQSSSTLRLIPGRDISSNYSDQLCVEIYNYGLFVCLSGEVRKCQLFKGISCKGDIDAVKGLLIMKRLDNICSVTLCYSSWLNVLKKWRLEKISVWNFAAKIIIFS